MSLSRCHLELVKEGWTIIRHSLHTLHWSKKVFLFSNCHTQLQYRRPASERARLPTATQWFQMAKIRRFYMKRFHEFFLVKFSSLRSLQWPETENLPNCCKHKYDSSISRTFLNLIFGGNLILGPTVRHPDFYNWIFHAWLGLPSYRSRQGALRSLEAPREKIRHSAGVRKGVKSFEYCHIPINYAHVYGPILHVPCQ